MPRAHPPEFRQRAVELARLREKPTRQIAEDLGISDSCLRSWMRQGDINDGRRDGTTPVSARRRADGTRLLAGVPRPELLNEPGHFSTH